MKPARTFLITFFLVLATGVGSQLWLANHFVVPILMYHHVDDTKAFRTDTVSPEHFAYQMEFLRKNHFRVISLDQLIEGIKSGRKFPFKTVVITFDDGYQDNFRYAYPVLREHNFPATFFVISGFFGKTVDQNVHMSVKEMLSMKGNGIDFGSHSIHHTYLPDAPVEDRKKEIFESKPAIEKTLGIKVKYFVYPIGGFNDDIKKMVQAAGYSGALTTNRGRSRFNDDPYELNRVRLSDHDNNGLVLTAKLSGFYNLFRKPKKMDGTAKVQKYPD